MYKSILEKFITDELNSEADRLLPSSGSCGAEEWPHRGLGQENEAAEEAGSHIFVTVMSCQGSVTSGHCNDRYPPEHQVPGLPGMSRALSSV